MDINNLITQIYYDIFIPLFFVVEFTTQKTRDT